MAANFFPGLAVAIFVIIRAWLVVNVYYNPGQSGEVSFTQSYPHGELCWYPRPSDELSGNPGKCFPMPKDPQGRGSSLTVPPYYLMSFKGTQSSGQNNTHYFITPQAPAKGTGKAIKFHFTPTSPTDYYSTFLNSGWLINAIAQRVMHPFLFEYAKEAEPFTTPLFTALIAAAYLTKLCLDKRPFGGPVHVVKTLFIHKPHGTFSSHHAIKVVAVIAMVIEHTGKCFFQENFWFRVLSSPTAVLFYFLIGATEYRRYRLSVSSTSKKTDDPEGYAFDATAGTWFRSWLSWILLHFIVKSPLHTGTLLVICMLLMPKVANYAAKLTRQPLWRQAAFMVVVCILHPLIGEGLHLSYGGRVIFYYLCGFATAALREEQAKGGKRDGGPLDWARSVRFLYVIPTSILHFHYVHLTEIMAHVRSHGWVDVYPLVSVACCFGQFLAVWNYNFVRMKLPPKLQIILVWIAHYSVEIFTIHLLMVKWGIIYAGIEKCTGTF